MSLARGNAAAKLTQICYMWFAKRKWLEVGHDDGLVYDQIQENIEMV